MGRNKGGFNRTLTELWIGILAADLLMLFIFIWFVVDKLPCITGWFFGMLIALASSYHLSFTLNKYLDYPEKKAKQRLMLHSLGRYLVIAFLLYLIMISGFANPLTAFAGIMGLKFGAYLQPFIHKITVRKYPDPEPPPGIPDEEEEVVK